MRISKLSKIWVFLFVCGFLSLIILFFTLIFLLSSNKVREAPKMRTYQYQELSSSSNDISMGLVTLNKALSDDEFISYHSTKGNQIVISNFASSQFKCEGTCSCRFERRSLSSNTLSGPLLFVISAISTSVAVKIAGKAFHSQCLVHFSSSCDEENIQSSVTSCSEKEERPTSGEEEEKEYAEYSCEGYCITNKQIRSPDGLAAQKEYLEETGGCENLKTSGSVRIERKINEKRKQKLTLKRTGEEKEYPDKYYGMHLKALQKFSVDYLTSFCKEMSQKEYVYQYPNNPKKRQRQKAFMCVGGGNDRDFPDERLDYPLQNVKCVLTSEDKRGEKIREALSKRWGRE